VILKGVVLSYVAFVSSAFSFLPCVIIIFRNKKKLNTNAVVVSPAHASARVS
jgi:hypothetical protein